MEVKMSLIPGGKKGKVGKINVKLGDKVNKGDILVQVETGKGNRPIKATESGTITNILCEEGKEVASNEVLFEIKSENSKIMKETKKSFPLSSISSNTSNKKEIEYLKTDLLIIGAGPGGYVAAIYAAKKGINVTLVEKEKLGGTCLNVGCIPTKAFVKSSEICHSVKRASTFGIKTSGEFEVDMERVISRKNEVKEKLISGISFLMDKNRINVISGEASFISNKEVFVKGNESYNISAKNIIIATGSKISHIKIPGIDLPFVLNSTKALDCTELPKSITIIGGGVIGMEFAFIYRNMGVEVTVIEFMDRLLTMVDKDVSEEIKNIAEEAGIYIHTSSKVLKIQSSTNNQAIVTYEDSNGEHLVVSEKVLVAIGRQPNLDSIHIENTEVELNDRGRGIKVDSNMRTNVKNIYAIGDVTNIIQLAHVASHQGIVAVDNIIGEDKEIDYSAVPNVIFTSPEISSVGLSEDECKNKSIDYSVSKFSFEGNGKALTMDEPRGFIKLIKDNSTNKIIGGTIIGADASSLVSTLTLAIKNGLTDKEITETIFAHPTTAEVIHEAAFGLSIGALHQ
ncbi:dihydrolipoyl dehydrogenase [Clostridium sp.]|jgi:dihydrolipoamide dehydrogenase|uniref:dihydrolipoyl dehydrogenase n=1 Tax=Clostridium sp. TaxID=1506 RepID=UPI003A5BB6A9